MASAGSKGSKNIPADKINLKLILVSGRTHENLFSLTDSASVVTQYIYDNWPEDWAEENKPETNILRLIYQGRFLHGNVTLAALKLTPGRTTVMHLVSRENLPEPSNKDQLKKDKSGEAGCANCCTIL
ncbi:UBL3 [Bugula neritina]|uniref:UBL3 n=1 Tax=Bugula neritina TaxID=10212 RepID=A0A7J7KQJ0_BUGNE|nr:UBL3 [Bugula neritina]